MNRQTATVEKILSKKTVDKLDAEINKGNIEQVRKQLEKLFTFKNIYNMHDDHVNELAECIIDLGRADDRLESACEMEQYIQRLISNYAMRKRNVKRKNEWAAAVKNADEMDILDLEYQKWVYESGFEYSKFHMYSIVSRIIQAVKEQEKEGSY